MNKHPYITIGMFYILCGTLKSVVKTLKGNTSGEDDGIVVIINKRVNDDMVKTDNPDIDDKGSENQVS